MAKKILLVLLIISIAVAVAGLLTGNTTVLIIGVILAIIFASLVTNIPFFILLFFAPFFTPPPPLPKTGYELAFVSQESHQQMDNNSFVISAEAVIDQSTDDAFLERIGDPITRTEIIQETRFAYCEAEDDPQFSDFSDFLSTLYTEMLEVLSNPEDLAPIIVEVFIVSSGASIAHWAIKHLIEKLKEKYRVDGNDYARLIGDQLQILLDYFENTPKSRLAEIVQGTRLPQVQVQALLRLGPFDHEPGCFWRFMHNPNLFLPPNQFP